MKVPSCKGCGFCPSCGARLWVTSGLPGSTAMVLDLNPGPDDGVALAGAYLDGIVQLGNHVYFAGDNGQTGWELWRSDGTAVGTTLVADIFPGITGAGPGRFTVVGNSIFFMAYGNNGVGRELWKSDGTTAGTLPLFGPAR